MNARLLDSKLANDDAAEANAQAAVDDYLDARDEGRSLRVGNEVESVRVMYPHKEFESVRVMHPYKEDE